MRELNEQQMKDLLRFGYMIKHFEIATEKHREAAEDALRQIKHFDELAAKGEVTEQLSHLRDSQEDRAERERHLEREAMIKRQQVMNRLYEAYGIDSL